MKQGILLGAALSLLAGCASMPAVDQVAVNARAETIALRIARMCVASELFRPARDVVDGVIVAAYPIAALPIALKNAGVERGCANPEAVAHDAAAAEAVMRALAERAAQR